MMNNKLLDSILHSYLFAQKMRLEKDPKYKRMTFDFIAKTQDPSIEEWHLEFVKKQLFDDGFLKLPESGKNEPFELTPAGIKVAQAGW